MKTQRRLVSIVLAVAMTLSLFGGYTSAAAAPASTTVKTDSELAYAPLTQTAGIVYEQHENGYAVSLDRAADSVTMNITAAPGDAASRTPEKARLYIRTGVTLKANTAYRVSFSLRAEQEQPDYTVCFDSASKAAAFGTLNGRSIKAGSTDQVKYQIAPQAEQGELVLRLLLGKTEAAGNALRFSDLAVEEVTGTEVGKNAVLADSLNLNTPGFIRSWAHTDSGATVTCNDDSVTMTITKTPGKDAEVWKIKLFIATGLNPAPGKMYRFTADAVSTAPGAYELCVNENDTEKGFGAFYSQSLSGKPQKLEYIVYVANDKTNPGELIFQFSLGNLKTGTKVTLSNVALTEIVPSYKDILPDDFAFTTKNVRVGTDSYIVSSDVKPISTKPVNWTGTTSVATAGNNAGNVIVQDDSVTLEINDRRDAPNPWTAMLHIFTGWEIKAGDTYRISFDVQAVRPYSKRTAAIHLGSGYKLNGDGSLTWDNNEAYGGKWNLTLGTSWQTISSEFTAKPGTDGKLMLTLQAGAIDGHYNEVTVRNVRLEKLSDSESPFAVDLANVHYPIPVVEIDGITYQGKNEGGNKSKASIDGNAFKLDVTAVDSKDPAVWRSKLYLKTGLTAQKDKSYDVSFDIKGANAQPEWEINFGKGADNKDYGAVYSGDLSAISKDTPLMVTQEVTADSDGELWIILCLGKSVNTYWISNIEVNEKYDPENPPEITYEVANSDGNKATASKDGEAFKMEVTEVDGSPAGWKSKLYLKTGIVPQKDKSYEVSFNIKGSNSQSDWEINFGKSGDNKNYGEWYAGDLPAIPKDTPLTITKPVSTQNRNGELWIILCLGKSVDTYWISNVKVTEKNAENPPPADNINGVTYQGKNEGGNASTASIEENAFKMDVTAVDSGEPASWRSKLYLKTGVTPESGKSYEVSFNIKGANEQSDWEINFGKNGDNKTYGEWYAGDLPAIPKDTPLTVTQPVSVVDDNGELWIILCLGKTVNTYWISNVTVTEKGAENPPPANNINGITYQGKNEGGNASTASIEENAFKMDVTAVDSGEPASWRSKLYLKTGVTPESGKSYEVSFNIKGASEQSDWEINFGKNGDNKTYGEWYAGGLPAIPKDTPLTVTQPVSVVDDNGELWIILCLGKTVNTYWISNVTVTEKGTEEAVSSLEEAVEAPVEEIVENPPVEEAPEIETNEAADADAVTESAEEGEDTLTQVEFKASGSPALVKKAKAYNKTLTAMMVFADDAPVIPATGSFSIRDGKGGILSGGGSSATLICTDPDRGNDTGAWTRGLCIKDICDITAGISYEVSFDIQTSENVNGYNIRFFPDDKESDWNDGHAFKTEENLNLTANKTEPIKYEITPNASGKLFLRLDLGNAPEGSTITISNIKVLGPGKAPVSGTEQKLNGFAGVWEDHDSTYAATLERKDGQAVYTVRPGSGERKGYFAKLYIRTGMIYDPDKMYRAKFDITAEKAVDDFCVISTGVSDKEDIRGTWGLSIGAGETKTITTRAVPAEMGTGEFNLQIELGNIIGDSNTFTISNVRIEEVAKYSYDYVTNLICRNSSATLAIEKALIPSMMEFWRLKLFVDTYVPMFKGETYRVTFDVWAAEDMDFEVNYNRYVLKEKTDTREREDDFESGYGSVYGLHAVRNKETPVEHIISAEADGCLELQVMLGKVADPNAVSVRNLKIERVTYTEKEGSALPNKPVYQEPSAVSYWAHEDYTVNFDGTDKAITANIKGTPAKGAEPWKIKLFLDTGVVLEKGKYYKVTANVKARSTQDYEICYNNGGIEMGYDALGGLRAVGGETQTIERIISVPADKNDTNNLMLQINLGKTTSPNAVTVSDVKVEEVSLSYADMMAKGFAYTQGGTVDLWTYTDYTASYEAGDGKATAHITQAPETGAEVWKVKLFVNTGAMLSAGKTYLVRADMLAAKSQNYEVCFNNEETEKGFDAMYGQYIEGGTKTTVERKISVPASMTDAGQLVLQFAVGGPVTNDITVSNISVQELNFGGGSGNPAPETVVSLYNAPNNAAGTLAVTREKLAYQMTKISPVTGENAIRIQGANLRSGDLYTVAFTARADKNLTGTFALNQAGSRTAAINQAFNLTTKATQYSFTTSSQLTEGGAYDLLWQFSSAQNQKAGSANVEISNVTVYSPAETLTITRDRQNVTVNGKTVTPDTYNINGSNYVKLRDLALLLNDTDAQFTVRYNSQNKQVSLTTGKAYVPVGGELTTGQDRSASCKRGAANITVNGKPVSLKAYNFGGNNFFRLRDLDEFLGFKVEYVEATNTAAITSPPTPEAQEKGHAYDLFFLPEVDGEAQPYVGDTMPFYEDGVYYIYYLKDGGDAYNHSVYVVTTTDFVHYTEYDNPVLSASREDVQDSWIGTGSVVKVDNEYYFFYTGFNSSGSQEYHEKVMVAKSSSPTTPFEKVTGWEIVPPASLGQKNDFRDPQAYYDPASKTISLTITAGQEGLARILKYTLSKDLKKANYDGIIYTDPTGDFWNMECSDTFQIGNKWYLTYSGQDDTLWYAIANSRFGPYTNSTRLDGKLFYAAKHVEDGENTYMVGWARRANSASSTEEVNGWAGNVAVQKVVQHPDGTLRLVPVDSIVSAFSSQQAASAPDASLTAGSAYSYMEIFTTSESFMLSGEFTYSGTGSFGLAFDFNGKQEQYKLVALDPAANKLRLSLNEGKTLITETQAPLSAGQKHTFTYIQDGSIGIFYLDDQASLLVRVYGATDKPIYLFAENNNVAFTSLRQFTR